MQYISDCNTGRWALAWVHLAREQPQLPPFQFYTLLIIDVLCLGATPPSMPPPPPCQLHLPSHLWGKLTVQYGSLCNMATCAIWPPVQSLGAGPGMAVGKVVCAWPVVGFAKNFWPERSVRACQPSGSTSCRRSFARVRFVNTWMRACVRA